MICSQYEGVQIARIKKSCRRCERIGRAAPSRPIPRAAWQPKSLLAHILVAKFTIISLNIAARDLRRMANIPDHLGAGAAA